MNKQEIFNRVAIHLLTQNRKALDGGTCVHLTYDGCRRCAIGCLIPDEHNALKYRGSVVALLFRYPDLTELWGVDGSLANTRAQHLPDVTFLSRLQTIHDNDPVKEWKQHLWEFAENWNLDSSVLK